MVTKIRILRNVGNINKFMMMRSHCCNRTLYTTSVALNVKDSGRRYTVTHEWVTVNGDEGTVGITEYLQRLLGEVREAQLPVPGDDYNKNDTCAILASLKGAIKIYAPVSGQVTESNSEVQNDPSLINKSCYEKGWLFRLRLSKPEELKSQMNEKAYENFSRIHFIF